MSPVPRYAVAVLLGLTLGLGSAVAVTGGLMGGGALTAGRWSTDLTVGAPAATPWVRARIARVGLLALNRDETLYFDRATDEDGRALDARCSYRVEGGPLPARWWSVTIYGADQMLPRNDDGAASIDATRLAAAGAWTATVAAARPSTGAWISARGAGAFTLTLRLYNPARMAAAQLGRLALPAVRRVRCDDAGGRP